MLAIIADDFNDAWEKVNLLFLQRKGSPVDLQHGLRGLSFDNIVSIKGPKCKFNPGELVGYKPQKWTHLTKKYVDPVQLKWIRSLIMRKSSRRHNIMTFPYMYKVNMGRSANGSCMMGMMFRVDSKNKKIRVDIIARVSEVTRRMMLDYILTYRILEYLFYPDYWDYEWDIWQYSNIMYQSGMMIPLCAEHFDMVGKGISKTGRTRKGYLGQVEYQWNRYLLGIERKFAQAAVIGDVIQNDLKGIPRPSMPMKSMTLDLIMRGKFLGTFKKGDIVQLTSEVQFPHQYRVLRCQNDKVVVEKVNPKRGLTTPTLAFYEDDLKPWKAK
jgi:hypothetical protein